MRIPKWKIHTHSLRPHIMPIINGKPFTTVIKRSWYSQNVTSLACWNIIIVQFSLLCHQWSKCLIHFIWLNWQEQRDIKTVLRSLPMKRSDTISKELFTEEERTAMNQSAEASRPSVCVQCVQSRLQGMCFSEIHSMVLFIENRL